MLDLIKALFSPLIWVMDKIYLFLFAITGSGGLAIIILAVLVALVTIPLRTFAQKVEARHKELKDKVDEKVNLIPKNIKGEKRFRKIEKIYEEFQYHPISNVTQGLSFFVMLPILIAALFLFSDYPPLYEQPFLIIDDLSKPDALIFGFNLMPFIMSAITILDAKIRFKEDRGSFIRFVIIAAVLFILVYSFSAGLVLYWSVSNLIAFLTYAFKSQKAV